MRTILAGQAKERLKQQDDMTSHGQVQEAIWYDEALKPTVSSRYIDYSALQLRTSYNYIAPVSSRRETLHSSEERKGK